MENPEPDDLQHRILLERIRLVVNRSLAASLSTPIAALLLLLISWMEELQQGQAFILWYGVLLIAVARSISLTWPLFRDQCLPTEPHNWLKQYFLSKMLLGMAWSTVVWFLVPGASTIMLLMIYLVLSGVAAVVVIIQSTFWTGAMYFLVGMLFPLIVKASQPGHSALDSYIAISGITYLILLSIYSLIISQQLINGIRAMLKADMMANDLMDANFRKEEALAALQHEHNKLQHALNIITQMARHDELTQLLNRRSIMQLIQDVLDKQESPTLAMFDIDHFKQVNDQYGHDIGDQVLILLGQRLQEKMIAGETLARLGGEEFLILFSQHSPEFALERARLLCKEISDQPLLEAPQLSISASFGMASYKQDENIHQWLKRCDMTLYLAKQQGRNRVCVWENSIKNMSWPDARP